MTAIEIASKVSTPYPDSTGELAEVFDIRGRQELRDIEECGFEVKEYRDIKRRFVNRLLPGTYNDVYLKMIESSDLGMRPVDEDQFNAQFEAQFTPYKVRCILDLEESAEERKARALEVVEFLKHVGETCNYPIEVTRDGETTTVQVTGKVSDRPWGSYDLEDSTTVGDSDAMQAARAGRDGALQWNADYRQALEESRREIDMTLVVDLGIPECSTENRVLIDKFVGDQPHERRTVMARDENGHLNLKHIVVHKYTGKQELHNKVPSPDSWYTADLPIEPNIDPSLSSYMSDGSSSIALGSEGITFGIVLDGVGHIGDTIEQQEWDLQQQREVYPSLHMANLTEAVGWLRSIRRRFQSGGGVNLGGANDEIIRIEDEADNLRAQATAAYVRGDENGGNELSGKAEGLEGLAWHLRQPFQEAANKANAIIMVGPDEANIHIDGENGRVHLDKARRAAKHKRVLCVI